MKLGNTALAASFGKIACVDYYTAPNADKYPRLKALLSEAISSQFDAIKYRHPDPTLITRTEVTCPELQMRGFWEKLAYKSGSKRPSGRSSFSSWFWRGGIYICSGNNNNHEQMKDFWYVFFAFTLQVQATEIHEGSSKYLTCPGGSSPICLRPLFGL